MLPEEVIEQPISYSLAPFTGTWTVAEASHLLRRTMFGPTLNQINQAVTDGMNTTVNTLLTLPAATYPKAFDPMEAVVNLGDEWHNALYPSSNSQPTDNTRKQSLYAHAMERINTEGVSIQEKMCLFWANHFGMTDEGDARSAHRTHDLYRINCLGNFKQLVKDITIDPSMLLFLNGASNNVFAPNENYARELLELFTVGKGLQVGVGDYSNYTETDIQQSAKILTGWIPEGFQSDTVTQATAVFYPTLHDTGNKTLSPYFANSVISDGGANEYSNYIDVIFQQPNMAKYICRKLYRWFVNYDLTSTVENTVIAEMATTLESNNFDILPVVTDLLKSEHFYDVSVRGAIIKNPIEFFFSFLNATGSKPTFDIATNYNFYLGFHWQVSNLGQNYFSPPSVAGWSQYYQAPSYSKLWINAAHIKTRFNLSNWFTVWGGPNVNGNNFKVDALNFLNNLSNPGNAVAVIDDLITVFTPKGVLPANKIILKAILTDGQPDSVWATNYSNYITFPGNLTYSDPIKTRIEQTLSRIFQFPEFQTI